MAVADYFDTIQKIYIAFYQRPADPAGLKYWAQRVDAANGSLAEVIDAFANSAEAAALYGEITGETIGDIVDAIYQALFNRAPDAAGKQFYVDAFNAGEITAGKIALAVLDGSQGDDLVAINNKLAVANIFTAKVDGRPLSDAFFGTGTNFDVTYNGNDDAAAARTILAAVTSNPSTVLNESGVVAALQEKIADAGDAIGGVTSGQTFTLTTGEDSGAAFTGTAGNDTFDAPVLNVSGTLTQTLQAVDALNGGAGADTLSATINSGTTITPSLTAIENVNIRSVNANSGIDFSASTGVEKITVANSTATSAIAGAGAFNNIAVNNQTAGVTVTGSTATSLNLSFDKFGTKDAQSTIGVNTGTATAATVTATDSNVNIGTLASLKSLTVATTGTNKLASASNGAIETLTVSGTGSFEFDGNLTALKTLTSTAAGAIKATGLGAAFETATTGAGNDDLTVATATGVKNISTGAGDDKVTITGVLGATAVVDLGAGDDTLTLNTAPTAGVTLTAGEGRDTLQTSQTIYGDIVGFTDAQKAKITGFEVLSISTALTNGSTVNVGAISGITNFVAAAGVVGDGTATVTNLGAGATVEIAGDNTAAPPVAVGALVLSQATDTATDVLNLKLNNNYTENNNGASTITALTHTVTASKVETLNVESTGKASEEFKGDPGTKADGVNNTLTLTNNDLVTLNVTGDQAFTFTSAAGMTKLATIDASALTAGATISAAAHAADSAALTIKGSATAANSLTGGATADTIIGGAAADTITSSAKADTITLGGGNDTYVLASAAHSVVNARDIITDFNANTVGQGANGAATVAGAVAAVADRNGDVIDLSVFTPTEVNVAVFQNAADALTFLQNSAGGTAQVNVALDAATGALYIDGTDNGIADSVITLTGVTTIDAAAFVMVVA